MILIDDVLLAKDAKQLYVVAFGVFLFTFFNFLLSTLSNYLHSWVVANLLFDIRLDLYHHLIRQPLGFFYKNRLGEILHRIGGDVAAVQDFILETPLRLATDLITLCVSFGILLWLNWKLFLMNVALLVPSIFFIQYFRRKVGILAELVREKNVNISNFLTETLINVKLIKIFSTEIFEVKRFIEKGREAIKAILRFEVLSSLFKGTSMIIFSVTSLIIFLYGGHLVLSGVMTIGSLVAFGAYQARFFGPIQGLTQLYLEVQRVRIPLERILELMDREAESTRPESIPSLRFKGGEVEFKDVSFGYEPGKFVFENLSFKVPSNSVFAIVGPSGVGKTTIANLLFRFFDLGDGCIEIDGHNIGAVSIETIRDQICLLPQETLLFHTTIEENIRYGRRNATKKEIESAARFAHIHDFVESLPEGYNTIIGEQGMKLSGGQRQRIALARALLRHFKIMILDEATSFLEPNLERCILETLRSFLNDTTIIIISHRLSAVHNADEIIVLDEGTIVQRGTHKELIRDGRLYKTLYYDVPAAS